MMKTIRRSLSTLLFMLLLFGAATTVHASTQTTNERKTSCLLGDANEDGAVTVSDVTAIQRKIAGFSIAPFNTFTADVDKKRRRGDSGCNVDSVQARGSPLSAGRRKA